MKKALILNLGVLVILVCSYCSRYSETVVVASQYSEDVPYWGTELSAPKIQLPTAYDSRERRGNPDVKYQGLDGNCWAYAALSTLEISLLPEYTEIFAVEPMMEDKIRLYGGTGDGGNYLISSASLLSWRNPLAAGETEARWHVQEVRMSEEKDVEAIKEAVYLYGAVMTSFYSGFSTINDSISADDSSGNYKRDTFAYFCDSEQETNHALVILGWDDNFPKENFSKQPKEDGAFLCLNSWGKHFGDEGYFYVSYEDTVIGNWFVSYSKIEKALEGQSLYQTDESGWRYSMDYDTDTIWLRNSYSAKADENLYAVGLYFLEPNQKYEVYAGTSKMELVAIGSLGFTGYATIPFEKEIELNEGEEFQVMVRLQTEDGQIARIAVSNPSDNSNDKGYTSQDGKTWDCLEENNQRSLCLKAYAISREE